MNNFKKFKYKEGIRNNTKNVFILELIQIERFINYLFMKNKW